MKTALIVVDLQNDFVTGSLAVKDAAQIVPIINKLLTLPFDVKVATQDWHPKNHGSFASNHQSKNIGDVIDLNGVPQILWPDHCIQESWGAEFIQGLETSKLEKVFKKGTDSKIDSYSTFFDNNFQKSTGLHDYLLEQGVEEIYLVGLATDYCVKYSSLDGRALGYKVFVIKDGCKAVNLKPEDEVFTYKKMQKEGINLISSIDVINLLKK